MNPVLRYHEATKHHFGRFARSPGYLDWATQPDPFRRYAGVRLSHLPHGSGIAPSGAPAPLDDRSLGEFLRCSMGLSAWKQFGQARWALRVNPSSGNLHPTEAYVIWQGRVCHYAPREHALEERCTLTDVDIPDSVFFVGLSSIHWREAWKYGERAFRYCQHDVGHAIGALRVAADLLGWRLALLSRWSDAEVATVLGLDREADFVGAEREEPDCIAVVTAGDPEAWRDHDPQPLVEAATKAVWNGTANRLSPGHVEWPAIDEVSLATRFRSPSVGGGRAPADSTGDGAGARPPYPRDVILQRRSALGFDPRGTLRRDAFLAMLARLQPAGPTPLGSSAQSPWDAIDWPPHVHLIIFVHRVEGVTPGIYACIRSASARAEWKAAMRAEFLWERVSASGPDDPVDSNGLFLLVPLDVRHEAIRVSCDQDIAGDGFFSLGMIARLEGGLRDRGDSFYRRLFWECGLIGQVLYLEAEAVGARGTGIGCFYDDPVHEMLGLSGHAWQSLYHFSMGLPVDDGRLTTERGYEWET
ncbi:MAG: SagB/ThcOx family dehydrogenase [Vicinamibacterales bacterium]